MAKLPPVKCLYCKQSFYREETDFIKVNGNRYAHRHCAEKELEKEKIIQEIHQKMKDLCGEKYSKSKIEKQIKSLLKDGKTEIGILKTLEYWYDERQEDPNKANGGIGIVDYVYGQAQDFYFKKEQNKNRYVNKNIQNFLEPETINIKIKPQAIKKPKRIKLFDLQ